MLMLQRFLTECICNQMMRSNTLKATLLRMTTHTLETVRHNAASSRRVLITINLLFIKFLNVLSCPLIV